MFTRKHAIAAFAVLAGLALAGAAGAADNGRTYDLGTPVTHETFAKWDIDVPPSGKGLPEGSGSVAQGREVYAKNCASCHGEKGEGGPMNRLVGGRGTLASDSPVKTVGSYWPDATTVFDYVHRAMPFTAPESLSAHQVYAVTAYLLHLNGIVPADATLDRESLPEVKMPNRDGFVSPDPRPDTDNTACMEDCGD
ncbi:cytochrome c [Arhodomonas aquaeolei]|uniref:c-type cytochrome n=1 Tax=Arhodomonas aquaeolei TaxID=2369 RepID=UPI002168FF7A|nr:cytochrome c [Arhodomonas aquaeolei]MCS4502544.1 cytochrome c [Arhodomonas aquaeolei]